MPEHLTYYNGSMYDIVNDASLKYPSNIALEFFDIKYTFKQMINKIDTVAVALKKLNIKSCIECGLCTYTCTSKIQLMNIIRQGKRMVK